MSTSNTNMQTQSSNALHNAILEAGSKGRPPMLAPGLVYLESYMIINESLERMVEDDKLVSSHRFSIISKWERHKEKASSKTEKSSMKTSMVFSIISWKIATIHLWNVPGSLQRPKGILRCPPLKASFLSEFSIDFTMNQEMNALLRNGTWEIVELPEGRKAIGSIWIYKIKFRSSGEIVTIRCLLNIVMSMSWPVFQLDVNNAFLYGDLEEVVYMKPPEGYFPSDNKVCRLKKSLYGLKQALKQWNAKLTYTIIENGFSRSKSDYSLYTKSDKGMFLALLVYMDDIIITGNSISEIEKFKVFLKSKFMIKDLGKLKYFLGIEVVDIDKGLGIHIAKTSMFLNAYSDADWAKCIITRKSVTGALASVTSEVIWILKILKDLQFENLLPVSLHCDSNSAIKITVNPVFHERTKHLEINLHFVREKILKGVVKTVKVDSANQIADILTKGLDTIQHLKLVKKTWNV
ncbi:ribonuclease H-like domain-containing protein [Tanacetum coccineum]|uniref:Ribonuclease H-like domain-containing protein n=1 Tax=Tanacetum coccineum TaxID=301880 RepID=A0ABQ5FPZ9_9ASTR